MSLRKVDRLLLSTTQGPCEIQLLLGDITKLSMEDKVDLLIVSAFPCDYSVATQSLIKSLHVNLGLSVGKLSRDKDMDLRKYYSCWLSKPLSSDLPFSRLACFEKRISDMHPIEQIQDMFRGFMPIFNSQDTTVITPLLGTGCQNFDEIFVLETIVEAACNWMRVGLPLRCLKIVLYEKDTRKATTMKDKCIEKFAKLKKKWEIPLVLQILKKSHDVYISYSPKDVDTADMLVKDFVTSNQKIKVFSKRIQKKENKVWPEHIISVMSKCRRVLVILTCSYLETKDCLDEFNIALCYKREAKELKLIPLCIETLQNLPPVISNVQYMDCRLNEGENLSGKLLSVCEKIIKELIMIPSSKQFMSSVAMKKLTYDIFVSYPTKHGDKMKVVYEILRRHNPNLNIFYDKLELQTGSNWQQSIYDALEVATCCLILVAPAYFESAMCQEEFNIVVTRCLSEKQENRIMPIPMCIVDVEYVPDWFGQLNIIDARESLLVPNMEKLATQLHSSFKDKSIWNDFDWLITKEVKNRISIKKVTMQYRQLLFNDIYFTEETVVRKSPFAKCNDPCNVLFCFAPSDMKFAASLMKTLLEYMPLMKVLLFDTSHQNRLSLLDTTDYIVMFVSSEYLSTTKALEELTICFNRQRRTKHRILHFACTTEIPQCPSYLQILPYSVVFSDSHWTEMRMKHPEKKTFTLGLEVIRGTFTCADYEIAAMNKFALDILSSIIERDNPSNDIGNLLNIFKIQNKHQHVPLHECLVPWPRNCEENMIPKEKGNKNSDESLEDETTEAGVHVANSSNENKGKETVKNDGTQHDDDTDKDIDDEACEDERLTFIDEGSLNSSDGKNDISLESDRKSSSQKPKVSIADGVASNTEATFGDDISDEKRIDFGTEGVIEDVTNSKRKPNELAEINAFSDKKRNIFPDKDVPKKDDSREKPVYSLGNENEEALSQGKHENRSSLNITCDPFEDKPVNSTETENRKDICKVRSRRNNISKVSICKLL